MGSRECGEGQLQPSKRKDTASPRVLCLRVGKAGRRVVEDRGEKWIWMNFCKPTSSEKPSLRAGEGLGGTGGTDPVNMGPGASSNRKKTLRSKRLVFGGTNQLGADRKINPLSVRL